MTNRSPLVRARRYSLVVQIALGIASCAHGPEGERTVASPPDPELTLIKAKCAACHPLPEAGQLPLADLPGWRDSHRKRVPLSDEDRARVERYLSPRPGP